MTKKVIEDFPEIVNWQPKCICCKLVSRRPEVLRRLHDLHRDGASGSELLRTAEDYLGIGRAPTRGSIRRHLTEHVDFTVAAINPEPIPLGPPPDVVPLVLGQELPEGGVKPIQEAPLEDDEDDAQDGQGPNDELWGLYDGVREVLKRVKPDILFDDEGNGKLATFQVNAWTSVVREARQLLDGIHKVQSANKTLDKVVQAHTKRFVLAFAHQLEREMLPIILKARDPRTPSAQVAMDLEDFLRQKLGDLIGAAAETALRETREEHRISEVAG